MIVTYSLEKFKDAILSGTKIHTIREDKTGRWKPLMKMHHWLGNPRNPSKKPHCFLENRCTGFQEITIHRQLICPTYPLGVSVGVDYFDDLPQYTVGELIKNDGLTPEEFREWFVPMDSPVFKGKILHWTYKAYPF